MDFANEASPRMIVWLPIITLNIILRRALVPTASRNCLKEVTEGKSKWRGGLIVFV